MNAFNCNVLYHRRSIVAGSLRLYYGRLAYWNDAFDKQYSLLKTHAVFVAINFNLAFREGKTHRG